jgi:hypothetical protein
MRREILRFAQNLTSLMSKHRFISSCILRQAGVIAGYDRAAVVLHLLNAYKKAGARCAPLLMSVLTHTRWRRAGHIGTIGQYMTALHACMELHRRHRFHAHRPAKQPGQQRQCQDKHHNGLFHRNDHKILLHFPCASRARNFYMEGHVLPFQ